MYKNIVFSIFLILPCLPIWAQSSHTSVKVNSQGLNLHVKNYPTIKKTNKNNHILLVHGLTYSSHEFNIGLKDYSLVRFLNEIGYNVWTIDLAGYGLSDIPQDGFIVTTSYGSRDILNVVQYIINQSNIQSIDLLGWSWGSMTTSQFANDHSSLVNRLILYAPICNGFEGEIPDSPWHINTWEHAVSDFQLNNGKIDTLITETQIIHAFASGCWKYDKDKSPNGGRKELMAGVDHIFISADMIKVPTLFIGGSNDPLVNWNAVDAIVESMHNNVKVKKVVIQGGGHALMMEKPFYHEFHSQLAEFLTEK